ncbi:DNA-processing protein DprA [Neptunitalea lumnitzerae]|uniref:DNA processing protein DprA n=1 Tax=Neptunitalea lumnitzerae TaxID=2965509 RepID=A0ABQ5MFC4_9FLAO|nr:DNA-processing protein DprA [Neptunitalea sp. Y10]GLB48098.1 DNA processing protein DprA [Neptunitalea sp. Y10]
MNQEDLLWVLALQSVPKIGDINAKKLINHCGSAKAVFNEKKHHLTKIDGIGELMIKKLFEKDYVSGAEAELRFIEQECITPVYYKDALYPEKLKHCIDAPVVLFQRGNINLQGKRLVSIVGTRRITSYGTSFCEQLVAELAALDVVIVSGFAYGVDICAHKAAMKNNLQTIGCLAHGLNQIYPKVHAKYMKEMEVNGGFVTDFKSTDKFDRNNFLRRNRIIAGLADATVVIESADRGGSLVTADIAYSYNRDVFAVPGRVGDTYSVGCNNLIKQQKAQMLTSAADLIYSLGWSLEKETAKPIQKQLFVELEGDENVIYTFLKDKGKQLLDVIALECALPIFKVSATLLNLEMKGLIRPLPGKLFEAL